MSLKVWVANENVEQSSLYCNYLTNDRDFDVISTKDGIETLNAYTQVRPSIFILDSFFSDLKYTDILDKLTNLDNERNKCNTVITVNNDKEQLLLRNAKKVHSILKKPIKYENFSETISLMKKEIEYEEISREEIDIFLFRLNINIGSNGADYLRSAIFYCYYNFDAFKSLDGIYDFVATQYNVPADSVKYAIRSALIPFNNCYQLDKNNNNKLYTIFDRSRQTISPKYFLEAIVSYLHYKKNKKQVF